MCGGPSSGLPVNCSASADRVARGESAPFSDFAAASKEKE
jgi:hypothetical protein